MIFSATTGCKVFNRSSDQPVTIKRVMLVCLELQNKYHTELRTFTISFVLDITFDSSAP